MRETSEYLGFSSMDASAARAQIDRALRQGATEPSLVTLGEALLRDFIEWEEVRSAFVARCVAAVQPLAVPLKTVICFDGLPGVGKTTHLGMLRAALGAAHASMADYARSRDIAQGDRRKHQLERLALHPADVAFLETLRQEPAQTIILEKFPRNPVEAVALVDWARREGYRLEGVFLEFPADPVASSVQRQLDRGARRGKEITSLYAAERAMKSLARSSSGRWMLQDLGIPVHRFDSTAPLAENAAAIRSALGLDLASLPFALGPLRRLDEVSRAVGVEAWVGAGHFYRPFWNGRFGPLQPPTDIDVAVDREEQVSPLLAALNAAEPQGRWSVLCPGAALLADWGFGAKTAREAKGFTTMQHRGGLVRWREGRIDVHFAEGAEASLRGGVLRVNESLLARLDETQRARALERAAKKIPRTLSDYPGLAIDARTAALLGDSWRERAARPVPATWRALKVEVLRAASDSRVAAFCRRALDPEEKEIALEILQFHQRSARLPQPPPPPAPSALPSPLEELRRVTAPEQCAPGLTSAQRRQLGADPIPAPRGFASWLHRLALEDDDATFREWLHDQVHHHLPVGGADPYLRQLLTFALFEPKVRDGSRKQSPMHQGWALERHLAASALELDTSVAERFAAEGQVAPRELRLAMRLAMLFHDTGKLASSSTTRRHAQISGRLWVKHRPAWFPRHLVVLVRWMVETHDLFGGFGRGLTEKVDHPVGDYDLDVALTTSYFGALDSQAVRQRLAASGLPLRMATAVNKAIWCADVGSIAALRWLLPVAELVEKLILCGALRERRRAGARAKRA